MTDMIERNGRHGWLQLFADPAPIVAPPPAPDVMDPQMRQLAEMVGTAVREALKPLTDIPADRRRSITQDIQVRTNVPTDPKILGHDQKGIKLARAVRALAAARGSLQDAAYICEHTYGDPIVAKALSESSGTGGVIVPPEFSTELIELLYTATLVRKAGPRILPMNSNVLNLPRLASGSTASYIGENVDIPTTEPVFDTIQLSAKKLAAIVPISNDLIRDSSPAADAIVRDDLVTSMSLREDLAFLRGSGGGGEPTGLLNRVNAANKFASTQAGAKATNLEVIADVGKMRRLIRASNSRMQKMAWFMSARTEGFLLTVTDVNVLQFLFRDEMLMRGTFMGFPYYVSTAIPENLGAGTNESELYLGDMTDFIIAENQQLLIDVSLDASYKVGANYVSAFSLDQTLMRVIARHDCHVRHDKSFSVLSAVKWA